MPKMIGRGVVSARRMLLTFVIVASACALLITACVAGERASSIPDPEPEATSEATPEPTPTVQPSPTPEPTPSPAPEPTATPEPVPTQTPEPRLTPEPITLDPPYPVSCDDLDPFTDDELEAIVEDRLGEYASGFGVVIQELYTGARVEINPDTEFYGASLYKTAVMYEILRQVEEEKLSLDQYVLIDHFYASQDLGTLGAFGWGAGSYITVADAVEASIIISDNATAFLLGDLAGWYNVDQMLESLGAVDTRFSWDTLPTTSHDIALVLQAIACADGISETSSQFMLDQLSNQKISNRLPAYLPDEAVIGHKTGNWEDVNHDAGIVYGPNAVYVISVMSQYPGADQRIGLLSRDVYEYFHPNVFEPEDNESAQ
jgi:beta-lactamase class A